MKKKTSKYLEFYKECMKTGIIPHGGGLCNEFSENDGEKDQLLKLFTPSEKEKRILYDEGFGFSYWGALLNRYNTPISERASSFTPLRQTIVLFMHEMTVNPIK